MKLLSLSKNSPATTPTMTTLTTLARTSSWPWQGYCHQPQTRSFRGGSDDLFRSVNSSFLEDLESPPDPPEEAEEEEEEEEDDSSIEKVIRGARSEGRIVFEPAGETSSVLAAEESEEEEEDGESGEHALDSELPEAGVATCVVVDSHDPYRDFRASMEEMVEANALGDKWDSLEDLLQCYLRVNDRSNHAYILRAFVDLLLTSVDSQRSLSFTDAPSCSCNCNHRHTPDDPNDINSNPPTTSSPCSPLSFYTSSSSCCSSSDSLSTTPFCISVTDESQENSDGKQCVPFAKAEDQKNREGDHNSPSSSTSSSSSDV